MDCPYYDEDWGGGDSCIHPKFKDNVIIVDTSTFSLERGECPLSDVQKSICATDWLMQEDEEEDTVPHQQTIAEWAQG